MQVGPRGLARAPHAPDDVPLSHPLPWLREDLLVVRVPRDVPAIMHHLGPGGGEGEGGKGGGRGPRVQRWSSTPNAGRIVGKGPVFALGAMASTTVLVRLLHATPS